MRPDRNPRLRHARHRNPRGRRHLRTVFCQTIFDCEDPQTIEVYITNQQAALTILADFIYRRVADGNLGLLEGFDFNRHASLGTTLELPLTTTIDRESGALTLGLPAYKPKEAVKPPYKATHFRVTAIGAEISFEHGTTSVVSQNSGFIPLNNTETEPLTLTCEMMPNGDHPLLLIAGLEFYLFSNLGILSAQQWRSQRLCHSESRLLKRVLTMVAGGGGADAPRLFIALFARR